MGLSWSHAVLLVRNKDKMLDFYTRVLGFQVTDEGPLPDGRIITFLSQSPDEHHQIGMTATRTDDDPPNSLAHLAFRTGGMGELRGLISRIESESIKFRPTSHGNTWSVYFQDPELNGIEIFCDTPWHVQQPQGEVWDTTLDDDALKAWTHAKFENVTGFVPKADYIARRRKELAET